MSTRIVAERRITSEETCHGLQSGSVETCTVVCVVGPGGNRSSRGAGALEAIHATAADLQDGRSWRTGIREGAHIDASAIETLLQRKPLAGMNMLAVLGKQFHASQQLVRVRAMRNANEIIDERETLPQRIADQVVTLGGYWN